MTDKLSHKMYTAKDIEKFFGINANTLFYWVQTRRLVKPTILVRGRGKRNRFSLSDLATLYLINVLNESGLGLSTIEDIFVRLMAGETGSASPLGPLPADTETGIKIILADRGTPLTLAFLRDDQGKRLWGIYKKFNVWDFFRKRKAECRERGYVIFFTRPPIIKKSPFKILALAITDTEGVSRIIRKWQQEVLVSYVVINLMAIIKYVEEKTGEEF